MTVGNTMHRRPLLLGGALIAVLGVAVGGGVHAMATGTDARKGSAQASGAPDGRSDGREVDMSSGKGIASIDPRAFRDLVAANTRP
ncbi:hypothetical protein [Streptomyces sp. H27-H5]|uniref:hypothetical protein n=1 Tax=Streptomyces sp. H27-H5 TaxID=2996460 RepID=UPI00226FC99E|nr:hypothetical protein [Streptomyces sp. H27-H5]MCY0957992.1 hypothetical protein [Streptomyces sp. H27-H5]